MKRGKIIFFLLIFSIVFSSVYALAKDEKDYEVYTLGDVVVWGQSSAVKNIGITSRVTYADIKDTDSQTVAKALQFVPGVQVTTTRKNEANISIQGYDQSQALILIDGVPYYETNYGKLDLNQLATIGIARIDVIKGAASVLYGANAMAGVVNIITKKSGPTPSFTANMEIGGKDGREISLSHGMRKGILNYWIGYTHREYDAWPLSDDFVPRVGTIVRKPGGVTDAVIQGAGHYRDNSDYKTDNLWAKVGIQPSDGSEYYVNMHYITTEKGDPPNIDTINIFPNRPAFSWFDRIPHYDDWGIDLNGRKHVTDKLTLQGTLFYHHHMDEYVSYSDQAYRTPIADSVYKDYLVGGMLLSDYRLVDWDTIRMSLHYRGDSHKQRDDDYLPFENNFAYTGSAGLENETSLLDKKLSLVFGISYDWFKIDEAYKNLTDNTGAFTGQVSNIIPSPQDDINPMIGFNYRINDSTRFFGSVARKTRFPTLNQLYASKGGNPYLSAEKAINYTIGINKSFNDTFAFEIAPFYHDVTDLISRDLPDPDPSNPYHNSAKVKMAGAEIDALWTPLEDLSLKLGYTYIHAKDDSPGRVTDKVVDVPKNKIDFRMNYKMPVIECRLDLNMFYFSKSYDQLPTAQMPDLPVLKNGGYTVFDGKLSRRFRKFDAYIRGENLFDKNYEYSIGYPAPGRSVWIGVSYNY